jgi:hypothetical protein
MRPRPGAFLAAFVLAASSAPLQASDDILAARFKAIEAAQSDARDRYSKELQQVERTVVPNSRSPTASSKSCTRMSKRRSRCHATIRVIPPASKP